MAFAGAANRIGPQGEMGPKGKDGATWLSGIGEPSDSIGAIGDFYLNYKTSDVFQRTEETWVWQTNIQGKKGKDGQDGKDGTNGRTISMGSLSGNGTPYITAKASRLICTTRGTIYSFDLPFECKKFILKSRTPATLRLGFLPTDIPNGTYLTIGKGGFYEDSNYYRQQTLYIMSEINGSQIEIITYT